MIGAGLPVDRSDHVAPPSVVLAMAPRSPAIQPMRELKKSMHLAVVDVLDKGLRIFVQECPPSAVERHVPVDPTTQPESFETISTARRAVVPIL
jgi:hypothetical protein